MNPFLYPALLVLCLCGTSTVLLFRLVRNGPSGLIFLIFPIVWAIAACSLSAIALAAGKKTEVGTVLLVALVALVALSRAYEIEIRPWKWMRKSGGTKSEE